MVVDDEKFDVFICEGVFEVFMYVLFVDEDEVIVRGFIGFVCALSRRRALRVKFVEDGECVWWFVILMGLFMDESFKGFVGGLFWVLVFDFEMKGLVEKALREGGVGVL